MNAPPDIPASSSSPLMLGKGLERTYLSGEVEVHALRGVDVTLSKGELVVLLGPSGSGKSTLLNILGGLDRPTAGELHFKNEDLTAATDHELTRFRRRHAGFVFQFYNLIAGLTARENVSLVTEIADNPMRAEEALDLVGLAPRIHHFPAQLSGGEQQRVAVARAIAKRPKILFCDEPTGALDSVTGVRVLEALETVNRELSTTIMIITHNIGIGDIADRVLRMSDGRIAEETFPHRARHPSEIRW